MITGESLRARKSLMRMRIDRSIVYSAISDTGTQRTWLDSLLGVGCRARGRAVSTMENSCRASPLLVYAGDRALDPRLFPGLADRGLSDDSPRSIGEIETSTSADVYSDAKGDVGCLLRT